MASRAKSPESNQAKETILLRKPAPKYSFDARKLPKEKEKPQESFSPTATELSSQTKQIHPYSNTSTNVGETPKKPVAVVGASFHSKHISVGEGLKDNGAPLVSQMSATACSSSNYNSQMSNSTPLLNDGSQNSSQPLSSVSSMHSCDSKQPESPTGQSNVNTALSLDNVPFGSGGGEDASSSLTESDQLRVLREERDKLKTELKAQHQVNAELKRLLVASVGDDLYQRVENLCRDRAQLELDIGGFSKKMSEDYENLDKVSIQADMWRSKYLASRVMTEELSSAKAYMALQCHDSHNALQQLLNERHELRSNLIESFKVLQQVKNAFDPLNTHNSSMLRSTNVLDLSRSCQQLSEAVRFRLLPANVLINVSADVSVEAWQESLTKAEQIAHEVLSRPVESNGPTEPGQESVARPTSPSQITRYHPATRFENLTMNCCTHCKGELNVI